MTEFYIHLGRGSVQNNVGTWSSQITIFQINRTSHTKHPHTQVPISSTPPPGGGSYVADCPSQGHHMTDGRPLATKVLVLCGRATLKKSCGNLIICSTNQSWSWRSNYHKLSSPLLLSRTKKLSHPQVEVVFHLETFPQVLPFDRTNLHCLRLLYLDLF